MAAEDLSGAEPEELADEYMALPVDCRVELLLFAQRFSAAILVYRTVSESVEDKLVTTNVESEEGVWAGAEGADALTEHVGFLEDSIRIAGGAAILAATSALELLVREYTVAPTSQPRGLASKLHVLLDAIDCPAADRDAIEDVRQRVTKRRNALAHSLNGSHWEPREIDLTPEGVDEALRDIGRLAELISALSSSQLNRIT